MKRLVIAVLLVTLSAGLALAQEQTKVEFANYYVVLAERGPTWTPQTDQRGMEVRMEVVEGLKKLLSQNDEVIIAGLVNDESGAEFIMIVQTEDEMGMRRKLQNAKNVANGFFNLEIHSWRAPAGLKLEPIPRR
jgi:hypothetical protein